MNKNLNGFVKKIIQFINHDLWELEPASLSKARRRGLKFLRVVMLVIKGYKEDNCPLHASALTFIFVMALVPFLVILFSIAKAFGLEQISEMLITKTAEMPETFQQAVTNIISTVQSASALAMGSVSTLVFLWIALRMLSSVEDTFNLVWGVKTPRTFIDKIRNYIVIMVATPVLLIIASAGQPIIMGLTNHLTWMPFLKLALQTIPVLTMAAAFFIAYIFLPNTKVRMVPALIGALIAALLATLFQRLIIELGIGVSRYNDTYGALAAIPFFLFWVQTSWMILLLGAEVAFSVQNAGTYARERIAVNPSTRSRLCLAFALMKKITVTFEAGTGPFDTIAYGTENRVPVRLVNDVISILAKNGLVAEAADRQGCYTLLRDPADISARMIADAILNEGAAPDELGMRTDVPMFGKITEESFHSLEKEFLTNF